MNKRATKAVLIASPGFALAAMIWRQYDSAIVVAAIVCGAVAGIIDGVTSARRPKMIDVGSEDTRTAPAGAGIATMPQIRAEGYQTPRFGFRAFCKSLQAHCKPNGKGVASR